MNQRVAKRIRKIIFGDNSHRTRDYGIIPKTGQIVCRGLRERYQAAKRLHKEAKRAGRTDAWIFGVLSLEGRKLHADPKTQPAYGPGGILPGLHQLGQGPGVVRIEKTE